MKSSHTGVELASRSIPLLRHIYVSLYGVLMILPGAGTYRGSVMEVVKWEPAPNAIIQLAHEEGYVRGLEQTMAKGEAGKIINIEGSGPTYGTRSFYSDS